MASTKARAVFRPIFDVNGARWQCANITIVDNMLYQDGIPFMVCSGIHTIVIGKESSFSIVNKFGKMEFRAQNHEDRCRIIAQLFASQVNPESHRTFCRILRLGPEDTFTLYLNQCESANTEQPEDIHTVNQRAPVLHCCSSLQSSARASKTLKPSNNGFADSNSKRVSAHSGRSDYSNSNATHSMSISSRNSEQKLKEARRELEEARQSMEEAKKEYLDAKRSSEVETCRCAQLEIMS